jgi:peptidoglycan/xylan/chitin deacetylase (PgdA/CDA1 family)
MTNSVPVLMYHALSAANTAGFTRWTLNPRRFEEHLARISEAGYRSVTASEVAALREQGGAGPGQRLVALTFDDAYADFHEVAVELLAKYRMTATLYVPAGHVGGRSAWMDCEGEGSRRLLSWTELFEIAYSGIEIGSHSLTHPALDQVPVTEVARQARDSKSLIEDKLGRPVHSFAYPYGRYNRRVRDAVGAAGYANACTMNSWAAATADHPLETPRLTVYDSTDAESLISRMTASKHTGRRALLRAERALRQARQALRAAA